MKKILFTSLFIAGLFGLYSFHLHKVANDIFIRLGLGTEEAESYISGNIIGGSTSFPTNKIMAKLALNKRAEAVTEIGNYIKSHVQSAAFAKEYSTLRQDQKPEEPTGLYKNAENIAAYKEDLQRWEKEYPTNLNLLLKLKLNEFLRLTSDIDYNAKLEPHYNKMIFSNPALEAKDEFWKACFRAGKPTVDAARAYAQQWLSELK